LGLLLRAEVELATGRHEQARATLGEETLPAPLAPYGERLRADALFDAGRTEEALVRYATLEPAIKAWGAFPQSLSRLVEALYRQGEYAVAARRYAELVQVAGSEAEKGMATFGHARGLIRAGSRDEGLSLLRTLAKDHGDSEGGQRARLLLLDEEVRAAPAEKGFMHILNYQQMGLTAGTRELREEAAFKHVLLSLVHSPDVTSLGFLEEFIRQHRNGRFHELAGALLNEILPTVVQELVRREAYFDALLLVEKYRHLLVAAAVKTELLINLGDALRTLGLLEKAAKVYFYMLDAYHGQPEEEQFYRPLLEILAAKEDHRLTVEYADRYLEKFPSGAQRQPLSRLKLKALVAQGDYPGAAKILTSGDLKQDQSLDLLAGAVFWEVNDPDRVVEVLERALATAEARRQHPQSLLLLAEAHFKQGRGGRALPLYGELGAAPSLADQAKYRRAQILLQAGSRREALKLFRDLAEKGTNPQWRQAAEGALFAEKSL
jgi:tetratricopeptide (TPR) repeat protein